MGESWEKFSLLSRVKNSLFIRLSFFFFLLPPFFFFYPGFLFFFYFIHFFTTSSLCKTVQKSYIESEGTDVKDPLYIISSNFCGDKNFRFFCFLLQCWVIKIVSFEWVVLWFDCKYIYGKYEIKLAENGNIKFKYEIILLVFDDDCHELYFL